MHNEHITDLVFEIVLAALILWNRWMARVEARDAKRQRDVIAADTRAIKDSCLPNGHLHPHET